MKDRKLATRYARALLSLLADPREAEAAEHFLAALSRSMEESTETRVLLLDPAIPRAVRKSVLVKLAREQGAPRHVGPFLATLVDHNRTAALPSIAEVYREEREKKMGIVAAEIVTPAPLDARLEEHARQTLERATGRKVRLTSRVEPGLIGGAVTRFGSLVFDGSLRTQLRRLRHRMVEE